MQLHPVASLGLIFLLAAPTVAMAGLGMADIHCEERSTVGRTTLDCERIDGFPAAVPGLALVLAGAIMVFVGQQKQRRHLVGAAA